MKKRVIRFFITLLSICILAGCTAPSDENSGNSAHASNTTKITTASPPVESGIAASQQSAESESPKKSESPIVSAVVFDSTVEDPVYKALGSGDDSSDDNSGKGSAALKLTMYEIVPGVYSGEGVLERILSFQIADHKFESNNIYRTGKIEIKPDETVKQAALERCEYIDKASVRPPELGDFSFSFETNSTAQFMCEYTLSIEGDSAQMHIVLGNLEYTIPGKIEQLPLPEKAETKIETLSGKCIYINSTFMNSDGYEYRVILTAQQASEVADFTGALDICGADKQFTRTDEAVSFKLEQFDEEAYAAAGGLLSGHFDAYGVIHASNADYFILVDGDKPLLEPKNSDMAFYGSFLPNTQAEQVKHQAEETKKLMHTLYDGAGKRPNDTTAGFIESKPAWYPDWLMPTPVKLFGQGEWITYYMGATPYYLYSAQYNEEMPIDVVFESYKEQLSGYEGYEECAGEFDVTGGEAHHFGDAAFVFNKGAYHVLITLSQQNFVLVVNITIV